MKIYLIRHTETICEKGICYGQADVDILKPYEAIFSAIKKQLPTDALVYSSPLLRCKKMAEYIYADITFDKRLEEMNFGDWELKPWNDIPPTELSPWMNDFVSVKVPNGESFEELHQRVGEFYNEILQNFNTDIVLFCHAGSIRSFLSHFHKTELKDAFSLYNVSYGEVIILDF
jgi:alpha-ribazole phosphatase